MRQRDNERSMLFFDQGTSGLFSILHMIGLGQRVEHDRLTHICFVDYDREIALMAARRDPASSERHV